MSRFVNNVFNCDALKLLQAIPTESIPHVIADPMYMIAVKKEKNCNYDWGIEPGTGKAHEFWDYHHRIYEECRRVLKPGGSLAWAMGCKFYEHFPQWFGGHRVWAFSRFLTDRFRGQNAFGHIWVVQTREQVPIRFPDDDALILVGPKGWWGTEHVCPKTEPEMLFMVKHLTQPGEIILDCFCGTGTTLVAAEMLGRSWIGCDLSKTYCQIAMSRLADVRASRQEAS